MLLLLLNLVLVPGSRVVCWNLVWSINISTAKSRITWSYGWFKCITTRCDLPRDNTVNKELINFFAWCVFCFVYQIWINIKQSGCWLYVTFWWVCLLQRRLLWYLMNLINKLYFNPLSYEICIVLMFSRPTGGRHTLMTSEEEFNEIIE
jgi:hypothetical protein